MHGIFGWMLLTIFLVNGAHALSCLMCNGLMKGNWEACPDVGQYHSMMCRTSTHHCIKIDGNQTIVNQTLTGSPVTKTTLGLQRNCGTPYNLQLFASNPPVIGCQNILVEGAPLTARPNPDGSIPKYYFQGEVCVCNADNCNI